MAADASSKVALCGRQEINEPSPQAAANASEVCFRSENEPERAQLTSQSVELRRSAQRAQAEVAEAEVTRCPADFDRKTPLRHDLRLPRPPS